LNIRLFDDDLQTMHKRIVDERSVDPGSKLEKVRLHLVALYRKNQVKINHSVIELLCAGKLIAEGYEVEVEKPLSDDLVCDVYGVKGDGSIIVEIETGFVPPSHALDPMRYCYSRIISKTARYSQFANRFVLGTTEMNFLPIPDFLKVAPRFRKADDIIRAKKICDFYYAHPPITLEQITYSELHSVFILDVDNGAIRESEPDGYLNVESLRQKIIGHFQ
jgi:hypothetical protein